MQFLVLGPLEVRSAAGAVVVPRGSRQRLLLAALVHAPRVVSSQRLIDVLWGDRPPADPPAALRTHVARLRALLTEAGADHRLQRGEPSGYRLVLAARDVPFPERRSRRHAGVTPVTRGNRMILLRAAAAARSCDKRGWRATEVHT
jgi:DNA-binding SARP family transcriptional activator